MPDPLLSVRDLRTSFITGAGAARVVDGVSFDIAPGEVLALVGESGSGKTAAASSILRLLPRAGRIEGGEAFYGGRDILAMGPRELRRIRGKEIAMMLQDPNAALDPVISVGEQVAEAARAHGGMSRRRAKALAVELLESVGIPLPRERAKAYPHQLSGGMKQRVLLAVALAAGPRLLIADEPTTALDATIEAQVIALLRSIRARTGMAILLITHDLGVVAELADRVAVMYAGRIVEEAPVGDLFDDPLHPYTRALFESIPRVHVPGESLRAIPGDVPDPAAYPRGCRFHPRCSFAIPECQDRDPRLVPAGTGRGCACIRVGEGAIPPWRAVS